MTIISLNPVLEIGLENIAGIVAVSAGGLLAWRLLRKAKPTRSQRRHLWNQKRSYKDLSKIREIGPRQNPGRVFNWLRKVDPYRFEDICLSELDRRKVKIMRGTSYSGDGGIDGRFILNEELWLVQCKRYSGHIKTDHVYDFDLVCREHNAKGLFIHTGRTPAELNVVKRQYGVVKIISGDDLMGFFAGEKIRFSLRPQTVISREALASRPGSMSMPIPAQGVAPAEDRMSGILRGRPDGMSATGAVAHGEAQEATI